MGLIGIILRQGMCRVGEFLLAQQEVFLSDTNGMRGSLFFRRTSAQCHVAVRARQVVFCGKNAFIGLLLADAVDPRLSFRAGVYILFALDAVLE